MAEAASNNDTPSPPPRRTRKKQIILLTLALLVAGGAGAGWLVTQRMAAPAGKPAAHKKEAKAPHFLPLEPFVVNLQDPGGERYAQIGVTLQYEDPQLEVALKDRLPAVRNNILLLISTKQVEDLLSTDGKQLLAQQIRARAALGLGLEMAAAGKGAANPIQDVLFSQFIVQ